MRRTVSMFFRRKPNEIVRILPADLQFLAPTVMKTPYGFGTAVAFNIPASPRRIDRIIDWGSQQSDEGSLIRSVIINELCSAADMAGCPIIEIHVSPRVIDLSYISNDQDIFQGYWDCSRCRRIDWRQTGDYRVRLNKKLDFQKTTAWDWVVSRRVREILESDDVSFRPLRNSSDFYQIEPRHTVAVEAGSFPIRQEDVCPVCGRYEKIWRDDVIAGNNRGTESREIVVKKKSPLSIRLPAKSSAAFLRTDLHLGRFCPVDWETLHEEPVYPYSTDFLTTKGYHYYFVTQAAYKKLVEIKVTGVRFRPVMVM